MLMVYTLGYTQFTIFSDSLDFMSKLQALDKKPDVLFLDIHMKPHTGFELLNMVRSHNEYQNTKVIALTASVMNEEVRELEAAGFDGAIAKPIKQDLFPQLVERILRGERVWYIS